MTDPLASWNEGPAKEAILEFVARTCDAVPEVERVAVFDNDGTLWCEKPMPIQLDFAQHRDKPFLRLLVLHDDAEREFDYVSGSEKALDRAASSAWTVVSMKNDWASVF